MCVPILKSIGSELTACDAKTLRHASWGLLYSIGPINVCTDFEINRYKIDEVRKYAKIAFYLIYLTSCDAKTLRHASWGLRHF